MNKKVLHLNSNYFDNPFFQDFIKELDTFNIESSVFIAKKHSERPKTTMDKRVVYKNCIRLFGRRASFFLREFDMLKSLLKALNPKDYDLVHAYMIYTQGTIAYILNKKFKIPYIVNIRKTDIYYMRNRIYLKGFAIKILLRAEKIVALSPSYAERLLKWVPQKHKIEIREKITIIPNGIGESWLSTGKPRSLNKNGTINILAVGKITKEKNVLKTLEAVKIMNRNEDRVKFRVVGEAKDPKIAQKIKESKNTEVIPPLSRQKLQNIYQDADIFVMPSVAESFGMTYIESISQGVPVIYTKGEGFDQQFPEGEVGYHVDPRNAEEIIEAINRITKEYEAISRRCIQGAQKYSIRTIAQKYNDVYNCCKKPKGL